MKLSVSAYRAHASAHKKILSSYQQHYGSTSVPPSNSQQYSYMSDDPQRQAYVSRMFGVEDKNREEDTEDRKSERKLSSATSRDEEEDSNNASSDSKGQSPGQRHPILSESSSESDSVKKTGSDTETIKKNERRHKWRNVQAVMAYYNALRKIKRTKSNQRWMKLRTTVQLSSAIQKKPPLKREDSFLKKFSTRHIPENQETIEDTSSEGPTGENVTSRRRRRIVRAPRTVVNPDENFYFYWLWVITACVLYNMWTLIVRQSFPELQAMCHYTWVAFDGLSDAIFALDIAVQLRTGYLEQGLMVYDARKLARHYFKSRAFLLDILAMTPLDLLQLKIGINPLIRFPRFLKVYRAVSCYYMVESRTVYPNFWRVINLIHILLILAHWFGCFYFLLSEAEEFQGDWVYPHRPGEYATLTRKYLGSLYWSTLTLTTIGDLPTPETNAEYVFTIVSYLIGVFIFATIVGQVGNVITNRNANRLEFERLLDGAKTYMRHHKVPGGMKRRVLRWYDYSWSRGRIQGGGDINTALGLLPDKLKTELALHVNLSVLKKVTIFQECQPEFLHDLVLKMKAYIFTPGDSICRKGEVAREMFIIADGILEVISETGRVLTTMKAGDFFGEIGILNLDGLNKRTADVRSVGYSELFSLSREDVLAAMKDYPEAQEILQTLGRKRLQEARNCSRHRPKDKSPDKAGGDESASKRIVYKIRSDVKGLRNAIRCRSRAGRRSLGESMEMHEMGPNLNKGVLRRMPRVESDEMSQTEESKKSTSSSGKSKDKVISPIGAGLPLLQRLKLLKEKQDREEKSVSKPRYSTGSIIPTTSQQHHLQPSRGSEPEVIGAGLPLLQRLLLLKAKEENKKTQNLIVDSNLPPSTDNISPCSLKSPISPSFMTPLVKEPHITSPKTILSPTTKSSRKNSSGSSDGNSKPKVSFKEKILQVHSDGTAVSQPLSKDRNFVCSGTTISENHSLQTITIPTTVVTKIKSPAKAVGTSFKDKLKLLQGSPLQKETKLSGDVKCAEKIAYTNEPPYEVVTKSNKSWNLLKLASLGTTNKKNVPTDILVDIKDTDELKNDFVITKEEPSSARNTIQTQVHSKNEKSSFCSLIVKEIEKTDVISKSYTCINDLSPEYSQLPFVKRLKILNDRHKESNRRRRRSSSLENIGASEKSQDKDSLMRCYSESNTLVHCEIECISGTLSESNETLERRKLKSTLKELSLELPQLIPDKSQEYKHLIRSHTVEGFAARHSKFTKSVTFDRHTIPSPPPSEDSSDQNEDLLTPVPVHNTSPDGNILSEFELQRNEKYTLQTTLDPLFRIDNKPLVELRPEEIKVPTEKIKLPFLSSVANQRKLLRGSLEEQEYFGELLLGIKDVIQGHLHDVQGKFQDRFISLELEVRKRDEIIEQLQKRIQELEKVRIADSSIEVSRDEQRKRENTNCKYMKHNKSSSSDDASGQHGFSRGDSLDTVFASSPPVDKMMSPDQLTPGRRLIKSDTLESDDFSTGTDDAFMEIASKYDLERMSYRQLKHLAENLLSRDFSSRKVQTSDKDPNKEETSYARRHAAKLKRLKKNKKSSEGSSEQDSFELSYPAGSISSSHMSDEHSLLDESGFREPKHSRKFFSTSHGKIVKTLSVDAGMHESTHEQRIKRHREHRKFSLGSLFGYARRGIPKSHHSNDIVVELGNEYNWQDDSITSTSSSSGSESMPKTPPFEDYVPKTSDKRFHKHAKHESSTSSTASKGDLSGSGGDWEILMLAEELNKRERGHLDSHRSGVGHRQHYALKELKEEPDTPQREDSLEDIPKQDAPSASTSNPHLPRTDESSFTQVCERAPLLKAMSLDSPTPRRRQDL